MTAKACPRCGRETEGTYSEGGLLWAICEDCMREEREEERGIPVKFECNLCADPTDRPGLCDICEEGITRED